MSMVNLTFYYMTGSQFLQLPQKNLNSLHIHCHDRSESFNCNIFPCAKPEIWTWTYFTCSAVDTVWIIRPLKLWVLCCRVLNALLFGCNCFGKMGDLFLTCVNKYLTNLYDESNYQTSSTRSWNGLFMDWKHCFSSISIKITLCHLLQCWRLPCNLVSIWLLFGLHCTVIMIKNTVLGPKGSIKKPREV